MHISTTDSIPGRRITGLCGVAMGSTVRTKNVGKDMGPA